MARPAPPSSARSLRPVAATSLLAAALLLAAPAPAREDGLDARYGVSVAGIRIAELALTLLPEAGLTRARLALESVGLAAAWNGARSELLAAIRRDGAGEPVPQRFEARLSKRDRERAVSLRYDAGGAIAGIEIRSRGRPRESEVPPALRLGTVDPLTALERLRVWLPRAAEGQAPGLITVPIFDGRKRLDLEARYVGRATNGEGEPVHELAVRLIGLFGFDEDDGFVELPNGERPDPLRVLVRADGSLLPLRIDVPSRRTGPVIELERDCRQEACPVPGG